MEQYRRLICLEYVESQIVVIFWVSALDHINYMGWLSVHMTCAHYLEDKSIYQQVCVEDL